MNYAVIKKNDIANGPGIRVSLFVSGCRHHCKNCFNYEAWDFSFGQPFTEAVMDEILEALAPAYVAGLSFLGGEPFEPENQEGLLVLARRFKERFPEKNLWCYTGFSFERDLLTGSVGDPAVARDLLSHRRAGGREIRGRGARRFSPVPWLRQSEYHRPPRLSEIRTHGTSAGRLAAENG